MRPEPHVCPHTGLLASCCAKKPYCPTCGMVKKIIFTYEAWNFRAARDLQIQSISVYTLGSLGSSEIGQAAQSHRARMKSTTKELTSFIMTDISYPPSYPILTLSTPYEESSASLKKKKITWQDSGFTDLRLYSQCFTQPRMPPSKSFPPIHPWVTPHTSPFLHRAFPPAPAFTNFSLWELLQIYHDLS